MQQLGSIWNAMGPQMKVGFFLLGFILIAIYLITRKLISDTQKLALIDTIDKKLIGATAQVSSAIISAEKKVKQSAGRGKKAAFDVVNFRSITRDMKKAGLPGFPPLILAAAFFLAFLAARFIVNVPVLPMYMQTLALIPFMFLFVRYSVLKTIIDSKKMKELNQLIYFIDSVQRAVSVGASPDDAVGEAILDAEKPLKDSLDAIKGLLDLGYDFVEAINLAAEQIDLPEFDIFAASLSAQASTGGTIGTVLRDVADIARSRLDLKKKISTMTAEGRFNALLLGSVPIGLSQYLRYSQPDYFSQLWVQPVLGSAIFFATLGLSCSGAYLALRISKISL